MLAWFLENTLVAGVLALVVALATRSRSLRPGTAHLLWVAVLCALLMPRLPWVTTPGAELRLTLWNWLEACAGPEVARGSASPAPAARDALAGADAQPSEPEGAGADPLDDPAPLTGLVREPGLLARGTMLLWLAGAAFVLLRAVRLVLPFQRLVRRSTLAPRELRREVRAVAQRLGVRAPEVRLVEGVASPSVWCLGRPRLLWPAEVSAAHSPRARRALIAHELAHLARRDHWVSWLELPAAALAWWNPLFWWIRGRIRHYAELSCDAWAVWAYPADRRLFAEVLIDLQARTRTAPIALQGLGATDSEFKDFERRLDMIMKKGTFPGVSKGVALAAAVIAVLASPGFSGDGTTGAVKTSTEPGSASVVEARAKGVTLSKTLRELLAADKENPAALPVLQEMVALDPEHAWAHAELAHLQMAAGQPEAAARSFQRQAELGYERPTALYNAACAGARAQNKRLALELLDAAVRNGFANSDLMAKDPDLDSLRSIALFQELAGKARKVGELRTELARLDKEGQAEPFLARHGELAALLSADGRLQAEHGELALQAGEAKDAALAFGRQIEAEFDVPMAHYRRACARARGSDSEGALSDLRAAVEGGLGYDGITKEADLDSLRALPGFAELERRLVAKATSGRELRTLLVSENTADMPALEALAADESQSKRFRGAAALALGRLQLAQASWGEAHATFERAASLGAEVSLSAFGMAEALAGGGRKAQALRHVQLALDLGYANKDALAKLLERSELASPAEAEELLARAEKAQSLGPKVYPAERGKAWAAGKKDPKVTAQ